MNVAGQPLMDHAELARAAARSPAAARSAAAHGSVCIHEPLQEREPLGNRSVQVPFRDVRLSRRVPLDGLDHRPAQEPHPCLVTCPRATLVSDSRCLGVSLAHEHSCPGFLNRITSPISAVMTAASTGPMPGSCWITW